MKNSILFRFALLAVVVLFSSCSSQHEQKPRFGFVINISGARFWDIAHAGCLQAAQEEGVELDFRTPSPPTAAEQKQLVEALISKGIQGMAITPLSPESMGRMIDEMPDSIPVICQDSDAPKSKRFCYIGTDNIDAGHKAGEAMKRALPDGGEVALFVGNLDVTNAKERREGVLKALEGSRCKVVETFTDGGERAPAQANVGIALGKYPNLKGIIGLWGYNGPAAARALEDSPGRDVKIIAADDDQDTLSAVRKGTIFCSIVQGEYEFGYKSIKMLAKLHRKEKVDLPKDKCIYIPTSVCDKSNVDEVQRISDERMALLKKLSP